MLYRWLVKSIVLTLMMTAPAWGKAVKKDLSLTVGVYRDIKLSKAPAGFGKDGTYRKLVKLQYNPKEKVLRFNPKKVGIGTLLIKHPTTGKLLYEFRIDVKKTDLYKIGKEIKRLLRDIEGVTVKILNNKVVVDGQILLPKDMNRIHSVVRQYPDLAVSLVTLSPVAQVKIAQFIERAIGNPEIHVRAINGKFILEGVANSKKEKDKAEIIAKTYVPDYIVQTAEAEGLIKRRQAEIVINLISVKPPPEQQPSKIVQVVVHYVELQKDYEKGFRFQWTPDIGDGSQINFSTGGRGPGGVVSTITGTISNLLPKLNWAKQHGHARVLQSSSIIVEDGKKGVLNSISNIPYQVVTAEGQPSTQFQEAGIRTTITPSILGARSDSVNLQLNFAVKSLVGMTASGPMTSAREIQTVIAVRSGQSAAVGGLISNDTGTDYNKLPANVSRNPLISLYASKNFRRKQSQFVVFVTPVIKSSASAGAETIKRKFRLRD